jgi:hypothetical protein
MECESVAKKIWIERLYNGAVKSQKLFVKYETRLICTCYHVQLNYESMNKKVWCWTTSMMVMTIVWIWPNKLIEKRELHGARVKRYTYPYVRKQQ